MPRAGSAATASCSRPRSGARSQSSSSTASPHSTWVRTRWSASSMARPSPSGWCCRRLWRNTAETPGRAERRNAAASVDSIATAIESPCVLASRRPSHPADEPYFAKASWSRPREHRCKRGHGEIARKEEPRLPLCEAVGERPVVARKPELRQHQPCREQGTRGETALPADERDERDEPDHELRREHLPEGKDCGN